MSEDTTWVKAITLGLVSAVLSLIVFLLYQVFMADILLSIITTEYESGSYSNANLVLFVGLMLILTLSLLTNLIFMGSYKLNTRILSNVFSIILTIIILFLYAWISIIVIFNEAYQSLTLGGQIEIMPYFFIILSAYILPSPIIFWIIALIVYHMFLIIFIKFFFMEKLPVKKIYIHNKKKEIDINKYSMI